MSLSKKINKTNLRLEKGDITDMEVEAFVFYAREDLKLGTGFGNAIAMRGGLSIQKELDELGEAKVGDVFITSAGSMKAEKIIHAVGPKFQEEDLEQKLTTTVKNTLTKAAEVGIKQVALPAMGAGFYAIPLPLCAEIMLDTITNYLKENNNFDEIIIRVIDTMEYIPFQSKFESVN